jgi:hypothetical protein
MKQMEVNEWAFTMGVINVAGSSWLIGSFPECYWIWHLIKMAILLGYRFYRFSEIKMQYFLLDWCYVINYLSVIYYLICVLKANIPAFAGANTLNVAGPILFRIAFTCVTGPLAMSILAFRNSLVFHSLDQIIILAVHWSPNLALWGMRWFPQDLEDMFPDTFHTGCETMTKHEYSYFYDENGCEGTFIDLWCWPVVFYLCAWAIPYALFFFVFGKSFLEEGGYATMFTDMKKKDWFSAILTKIPGGEEVEPLKYMAIHATACIMAFFLGPLMWHSFTFHTIYLITLFTLAARNGAGWYFRVFPKHVAKMKMDEGERQKQRGESEGDDNGEGSTPLVDNTTESAIVSRDREVELRA